MERLCYDLHLHSCLSPCGEEEMTPRNVAGMAMLNGVKVAALTDHNTAGNCPAFFAACREYGVVPVAGMELTTAEEIHMVCLFPTLESAMEFDSFLRGHRAKVKNRPEIFGEQWIVGDDDEVKGKEEDLLILATDLDLTGAAEAVRAHGGAPFPAHIDKQSNALIAILGDFPSEPGFRAAEFAHYENVAAYREKFPILEGMTVMQNSDAHALASMNTAPLTLGLDLPRDYGERPEKEDLVRRALISRLRGEA